PFACRGPCREACPVLSGSWLNAGQLHRGPGVLSNKGPVAAPPCHRSTPHPCLFAARGVFAMLYRKSTPVQEQSPATLETAPFSQGHLKGLPRGFPCQGRG